MTSEEGSPTAQSYDEVTGDLRDAIETLRHFAQLNQTESIPHCYHLNLKAGHLSNGKAEGNRNLAGLARCFFTALLSDSVRRRHEEHRDAVQDKVLKAIDIVRNSYPLLDKLKEGDEAQQKLADTALSAIEEFNSVINTTDGRRPSWGQRAARFFAQRSGLAVDDRLVGKTIELPLSVSSHCMSPGRHTHRVSQQTGSTSTQKVTSLASPLQCSDGIMVSPTHREVDAFKVKAVTMIRNYGFPSTSLYEALKAVQRAPVEGAASEESPAEATIVTFRQTLQPFPGEVIELEGSFKRDGKSKVASVPIPDSFRLASRSSQTGFPHPIQHNGWGLSDKLLPPLPDDFQQLPLYRTLYQHKRKMALALLPQGQMLPQAKELLVSKEEAYLKYADDLLALHRRLALSIIWAAGEHKSRRGLQVIQRFFSYLEGVPSAVHHLAQVYQKLDEIFIAQPIDQLQAAWATAKATDNWKQTTANQRYDIAKKRFTEESQRAEETLDAELPEATQEFLFMLGRLLNRAASEIVLQYMSEKVGYRPQPLSSFATKVQCATFKQLTTFLVDLEQCKETPLPSLAEQLIASLENDIIRFEEPTDSQNGKGVALLAAELHDYYNQGITQS